MSSKSQQSDTSTLVGCRPIFVVGSARSGTSVIVTALREIGIPGYEEGHYVPLLLDLTKAAREYYEARTPRDTQTLGLATRVPFDATISDLLEMIRTRYESQFPGQEVWFDKSPDGPTLRSIPYIVKMWPNARFIFMKRRAIENIVSRLKKFPHLSFKENCERWVAAMRLWKENKAMIPEGAWIEIDQRDVSLEPIETGKKIGMFLGLEDEHVQKIGTTFATRRPEFTGGNETRQTSLDSVGWSEQQKAIYRQICSAVNAEWKYSEDESYYSK